jgi:hypothetical protein
MVKKKESNTGKSKTNSKLQNNTTEVSESKKRYFKCIYFDDKTDIVNCVGRYSGKKPKQAANKALTALTKQFKEQGVNTNGLTINFGVIEQTRGSKRKKYYYQGTRNILKNPVPVSIKKVDKKTGKVSNEVITYKHQSTVKKIDCDKCPKLVEFNQLKEQLEEELDESEKNIKTTKSTKQVKKAVQKDSIVVKTEKKGEKTKLKKVKVVKKTT